jgi:uncharacterized membrane protein YGL010W
MRMRTQQQYLNSYQESHQNRLNQLIHVFCVPVIFFSTIGLGWAVPVGRWLGAAEPLASWLNLATLLGPLALAFYARLSLTSALVMTVWFAISATLIIAMEFAGWPVFWICAALWAIAWAVQFYGHEVEGAKPSFAEDLVFLLIGPLFVMQKLYRRLGL